MASSLDFSSLFVSTAVSGLPDSVLAVSVFTVSVFTASVFTASVFTASVFTASELTVSILSAGSAISAEDSVDFSSLLEPSINCSFLLQGASLVSSDSTDSFFEGSGSGATVFTIALNLKKLFCYFYLDFYN